MNTDYHSTNPIKHLEQVLADEKSDLTDYEKSDTRLPDEDRCRGAIDGLVLALEYLKTLSPVAMERLAKDNMGRTHPLLETYGINLNPPKDASYLHSNYWCVSDVRHLFGEKAKYMTDEDIASNLQDLHKSIESGSTESGWMAIDMNFEIKTKDDYEDE